MITIYEYILYTNPYVIFKLKKAGLLVEHVKEVRITISRREVIELMKHDHYKKIGRYMRQMRGRVIG